MSKTSIKFIELFAGIGGFRYGLEALHNTQTGGLGQEESVSVRGSGDISSEPYERQHTFTCVYSNEWDKYAAEIYKKHYGKIDTRDITTVKAEEIPDHDLLVGGFPCQAFSIAGKRKGFEDTRGTLFFEIARILQQKQPRLLLLENVKGLLSHDKGQTFGTILNTLDELGYDCQWQVLNSKDFGVPQNRERVFIVGHLRGTSRPEVFPIGKSYRGDNESKQDDSKISRTVSARFRKGVGNTESRIVDVLINASQGQRIRSIEGLAQTLSGLGGGQGAKTGLYAFSSSQRKDRVESRIKKGEANCLTTGKGCSGGMKSMSFVKNETEIRRLTPIECERLQGFPDNWTASISDTQRYKCLGNAVTTNVITAIGKKLCLQ